LPLLQRFQSIICSKDVPHTESDMHVSITWGFVYR
jgi:E3 ubiquitin-protein ligase HERC2